VTTSEPAKNAVDTRTLSGAERKALASKRDAMNKAKERRRDPTRIFEQSDRNKDGFVTLEEFIGNRKDKADALKNVFDKRDENNDPRLTLEELKR